MRDADAYLTQLQALLPPGRAWPRDPDSTLGRVLGLFADALARADARGGDLVSESDPRASAELLPEWEAMFGLPDICAPATARDTLAERRALLEERVTAIGGATPQYLIDLAASLGFAIAITEIRPTVCGAAVCGDELIPGDQIFTFEVHAPVTSVIEAECGNLECGDPLGDIATEASLECAIRRAAPAHTVPWFIYDL